MKLREILILSIFSSYIISSEILDKLPSDTYNWNMLKEGRITIWNSNKDSGIPWCRASAIYPFSVDVIYSALKNLSNYKNIFDRVTESNILDKNIVY